MTPKEFLDKVQALVEAGWEHDPEQGHGKYDDLTNNLLVSLGYSAGVELAATQTKWYA